MPSKKSTRDRLADLVQHGINTAPYAHDGSIWAGAVQAAWAAELDISDRQLRRLLKAPPFRMDCILVDGKKVTLLRLGGNEPPTPRVTGKELARMWRKHAKRQVNKKEFGCLVGLACEFGPTAAPKLLYFCIKQWPLFMNAVKHINCMVNAALEDEGKEPQFTDRYYKFPSIPVIRLYHAAAVSAYSLHHQMILSTQSDVIIGPISPTEALKQLGLPGSYKMPTEWL